MIKSPLIPERTSNKLDYETWNQHTSEEQKWELWDGIPFSNDGKERDLLTICLIYNMGISHLLNILPEYSKKELFQLLIDINKDSI